MSKSSQLNRKVGRLIAGRIAGTVCSAEELSALKDGTMGGITLFKNNAEDLLQLYRAHFDPNGRHEEKANAHRQEIDEGHVVLRCEVIAGTC